MDEADRRDIRLSLDGDGDAYGRIVRRYQQNIAGRFRRFTRDRGVLEELVHEVFVEAYFSLGRFRDEAPLEHWLAVIATRVGYQHWKQRAGAKKVERLDERTMGGLAYEPVLHELDAVLEKLSARDRLVVTLLYLEERSVAETAELTGWSRTMVKVQAFRRGKLRKLMSASEVKHG